jgi:quercetin dioxygenase-like cupin family protein
MLDDHTACCHNSGQPLHAAAEHFEQPAAHDSERNVMQPALLAPTREQIARLQQEAAKLPQLRLKTEHYFADGLYVRVVARPKGAVIVGKVHRKEHLYICLAGEVEVHSELGIKRMRAGDFVVSAPGTKRAVAAIEDSVCMTVHPNASGTRDLDVLEAELIEPEDLRLFDSANRPLEIAA